MLSLVATPIGNLADITLRALITLKSCDYILCEDTRHSLILLQHYEIKKPLKSYHKFNEASQADAILADLKAGLHICLISDAGTPGISDPGTHLVKACVDNGIEVTSLPGPCAAISALCCSGLLTDRFQFLGFLPRKENELRQQIQEILTYRGTTICYESPHRLLDFLSLIQTMQPTRQLVVARELTKKFEEIYRGTVIEQVQHWQEGTLKGEFVILFAPSEAEHQDWSTWTPEEHVRWIEEHYHMSRKEAIKLAAEQRGVPKREIYQEVQRKEQEPLS